MAASSSASNKSASGHTLPTRNGTTKKKKIKKKKTKPASEKTRTESADAEQEQQLDLPSPRRRTKSPGIRLLHGRIYDSEYGKTCHQCRQKTRDFCVSCVNKMENKQCTFHFCHKCLLNRYGEKAEKVALLGDWNCPKCRGICNCSFCRKKKGLQPTGVLVRTAKANGFCSVSEMLHGKGDEDLSSQKMKRDLGGSLERKSTSSEGYAVASASQSQKELKFDCESDLKVQHKSNGDDRRNGKSKTRYSSKNNANENVHEGDKEDDTLTESSRKKCRITKDVSKQEGKLSLSYNAHLPPIPCSSPTNCRRSPIIRLVGDQMTKLYDSENERSCHQCHTKIADPVPSCKNRTKNKQCTIMFCHQCLFNRYGEKVDEMVLFNKWKCPKCRGMCSCSPCMNEHGRKPTVKFGRAAIGTRSRLSLETLHGKDSKKLSRGGVAPVESPTAVNEECAASSRQCRREKAKSDRTLQLKLLKSNADDEQSKVSKMKLEKNECKGGSDVNSVKEKNCFKDHQISKQVSKKEEKKYTRGHGGRLIKISSDIEILAPTPESTNQVDNGLVVPDNVGIDNAAAKYELETSAYKNAVQNQEKYTDLKILLPQSIELKDIASLEIPAQDVGHALQFLEFCEAFGQVLDLRKGQPEYLLRQLACVRNPHRTQHSPIVKFHIQLLSMMLKDAGEERRITTLSDTNSGNTWLQALKKCISESQYPSEELKLDFFDVNDYNKLDTSTKLRILTFLCDEALGTMNLRKWIDEQNSNFVERERVGKGELLIKEKNMKRKLQDEFTRALLAKNGAPLSISEHEDFVSKVKKEAAETLKGTYIGAKRKHRSDAVRSEPILSDGKGRIFWRLAACSGKMDILLQEIGNWTSCGHKDRWSAYDVEQNLAVEKYLSSMRGAEKMQKNYSHDVLPDSLPHLKQND